MKTNVKQNVKVVVGDVKRKQVRKSSGAKASAKPPIVLNISNPQPYNNMYMEYFKKQLQNQEPIKATTLAQQEKINEREETKASKAGALHSLDREPNDVNRELIRQAAETRAAIQASKSQDQKSMAELRASLKPVSQRQVASEPLRPRKQTPRENLMASIRASVPLTPSTSELTQSEETQENIQANLQAQQEQLENVMEQKDEEPRQNIPSPTPPAQVPKRGRGRPKGSKNKPHEEREAQRQQREAVKQAKKEARRRAGRE